LGHETGAGYLASVAILGKNRLLYVRTGEIVVENVVHGGINGIVNVPFRNPFVVKSSGGSDSKIITAGTVQ